MKIPGPLKTAFASSLAVVGLGCSYNALSQHAPYSAEDQFRLDELLSPSEPFSGRDICSYCSDIILIPLAEPRPPRPLVYEI